MKKKVEENRKNMKNTREKEKKVIFEKSKKKNCKGKKEKLDKNSIKYLKKK